jgi:hypothetical protein
MGVISSAIGKPSVVPSDAAPDSSEAGAPEPKADVGGEAAAYKVLTKAMSTGNTAKGVQALKDFIRICTSEGY